MSKRRDFIKTSSFVATGSLVLPVFSCVSEKKDQKGEEDEKPVAEIKKMKPGIQVYSVRNQLAEDFAGTMRQLADIGYKIIEGYGLGLDGMFLGKISPGEYKKTVNDLGMNMAATHCSYFTSEQAPKMIELAKTAGVEYLVIPSLPREIRGTIEGYKAIAEDFNKIGELCNVAGIKFGYHNHAFEFENIEDRIPQEVLMSETQADLVAFEADLFWTVKGNYDPVALINKFPGRVKLVHVKDMSVEGEEATVGKGKIDFKSIFEVGKKNGLVQYFIEDEREDDPFANVKADFDYISAQDFV